MSRLAAGINIERPFADGDTVFDVLDRAASLLAAIAALEFASWKIVPPVIVVGSADLGIDKSVDGFMTDGCCGVLLPQAAGDLFG